MSIYFICVFKGSSIEICPAGHNFVLRWGVYNGIIDP